ncbi:MAG: hypothetical protein BYD32DRAFT_247123 [Podila humilis]|nr:MAG: hypothetical protein BYD32DRAFT_247123 [Podila humilis]
MRALLRLSFPCLCFHLTQPPSHHFCYPVLSFYFLSSVHALICEHLYAIRFCIFSQPHSFFLYTSVRVLLVLSASASA